MLCIITESKFLKVKRILDRKAFINLRKWALETNQNSKPVSEIDLSSFAQVHLKDFLAKSSCLQNTSLQTGRTSHRNMREQERNLPCHFIYFFKVSHDFVSMCRTDVFIEKYKWTENYILVLPRGTKWHQSYWLIGAVERPRKRHSLPWNVCNGTLVSNKDSITCFPEVHPRHEKLLLQHNPEVCKIEKQIWMTQCGMDKSLYNGYYRVIDVQYLLPVLGNPWGSEHLWEHRVGGNWAVLMGRRIWHWGLGLGIWAMLNYLYQSCALLKIQPGAVKKKTSYSG